MKREDVYELVANNLKKYRLELNLTIKELSIKSGINQKFIERLENKLVKRTPLTKIFALSDALNIPPFKFFE